MHTLQRGAVVGHIKLNGISSINISCTVIIIGEKVCNFHRVRYYDINAASSIILQID